MVNTTSQVFLGLTLGCARCHDHKFEPLTMLDYYRMVAVFDPLHRPQEGRTELARPLGTPAEVRALADRDRRIGECRARIEALRRDFRESFLAAGRSQLPAEAVEALKLEPARRTEAQQALAKQHGAALERELAAALPDVARREIDGLEAEMRRLREAIPDLPLGY